VIELAELGDEVVDLLLGSGLVEAARVGVDDLDLIAGLSREAVLEQVQGLRRVRVGELEVGREALAGRARRAAPAAISATIQARTVRRR